MLMKASTPSSVLLVCLGNICRSPTAEEIFRQQAAVAGLAMKVDSAGTGDWHVGQLPDHRSIAVAKKHGIDISTQRGQHFSVEDFDYFDIILVMDEQNLSDVLSLAETQDHKDKVRLFIKDTIVPDPYTDDTLFDPVYSQIEEGCIAFIEEQIQAI